MLSSASTIHNDVESLLTSALQQGREVLFSLCRTATRRLLDDPTSNQFFTPTELHILAGILALVRRGADQLGRGLIQDLLFRARQREERLGVHESITLPFHRQDTDYSCGAACVQAVLDYYGLEAGEPALRKMLGTSPEAGTRPEEILALLDALGLRTEARDGLTLEEVAVGTDKGYPVLACCQMHGGGHWVVLTGVNGSTVQYLDPSEGPGEMDAASWERIWHDTDADGVLFARFGIAVAPPLQESRLTEEIVPQITPQRAVDYLLGLQPDPFSPTPTRWGDLLARTTFTLAVATGDELLTKVRDAIADRLATGKMSTGVQAVQDILDTAGVSHRNPAYAEMVLRTNVMDAYNQSAQEELAAVSDTFPVWKYSNPHDSRSRPEHAERDGKFYPSSVPFLKVRGTDISDAANCRCVAIPVWWRDWLKLRAAGKRIVDGYSDPLPVVKR